MGSDPAMELSCLATKATVAGMEGFDVSTSPTRSLPNAAMASAEMTPISSASTFSIIFPAPYPLFARRRLSSAGSHLRTTTFENASRPKA